MRTVIPSDDINHYLEDFLPHSQEFLNLTILFYLGAKQEEAALMQY